MNVKDTLLMPKSAFEMRGRLNQKEPDLVKKWKDEDLYLLMRENRKGAPTYVLHDGPPYANGNIHCGHMLNRILKDFVVRYKNMSGFDTPFILGWDTHGLPIENQVTKSGVDRKKMPVAEFRKLCEKYAYTQVALQKEQIRRLGIVGDFKNPYLTLQSEYEAHQLEVFKKMALNGLIFRGLKPVYWSPSSESALAEAEIEYQDVTSPAIFVKFPVLDGKGVLTKEDSFVIWTTTPWTLPANLAISVHPDFTYTLYETKFGRLVLLNELATKISEKLETPLKPIKEFKGKEFEFITTKHPLYERKSLVILGDHVTSDAGTGAVHTAPGHGLDDYYVGQKYGLDVLCPVNSMGFMTSEALQYEGLFYEDANKVILEDLKKAKVLLHSEEIVHSYPHDWRTGKPLIFRATPQWFATLEPIREKLLSEIERVKWTPSWGKQRMINMVKDRADWCISRQRVWGVPLPIIYNEDGSPILEEAVFNHIIELVRKNGSNVWFSSDVKDLLPPGYKNAKSPNGKFSKETDIMDVWFDSGSSSIAVLRGRNLPYPSDLYLEGSDQYRGWFNSSLIIGVATEGVAPYKHVVTHGFVMDEDWEKMSKSRGNGIDPSKISNFFGADILRLWTGTVTYQEDTRLSEGIVKQVAEIYRKIRNTFKFMLGNLQDGEHELDLEALKEFSEFELVDKFILAKLENIKNSVIVHFDNFDFSQGVNAIVNFLTNDMSSFYLDITKDILYCEKFDSVRRKAVQSVIYQVVDTVMRLLTPILTFTMQEVYDHLPLKEHKANVQLLDFPKKSHKYSEEILKDYEAFNDVRDQVLLALEKARSAGLIGSAQEAEVKLHVKNDKLRDEFASLSKEELARLFVVSKVTLKESGDVEVLKMNTTKCVRCWNYRDDTIKHEDLDLCPRCYSVIKEL